jgi:GT2 family glycosyltransferase
MAEEGYLLHPELVESIPFGSSVTARLVNRRVRETLVDDPNNDRRVSVVVRTLNEAAKLEQLLEDLKGQLFSSAVEIIIVDNESTDRTPQVAKYYGAELVTLPRKAFTYPKSMNLGMEAANSDLVFLTVGHARLSNIHSLHAGARHFSKDGGVAGAFGTVLPNVGASYIERWSATIDTNRCLARPAARIKKVGLGVLQCTGAMIAKAAWEELGHFDERFQTGGEDIALARLMLNEGMGIMREPALSVHHSHGLGLSDSLKQLIHQQQTLRAPRQFDREQLFERRPDLRANRSASDP